VWRE
jgi:hypothetical protein